MANYGYLQVTRECNQKCRFCSNPPSGKLLDVAKAKEIIDRHIADGCVGIVFTGGEPTTFEQLPELMEYCNNKGIDIKMITNGQKLADYVYLETLVKTGLKLIHISIYSCQSEVQGYLSGNPDSFDNITKALDNIKMIGNIEVAINTTICKQNCGHLKDNVVWLLDNYPFISHFVWNNLDPVGNRAVENPDTIPRLIDFEIQLKQAADYVVDMGRSFRVERVPLCYLPGYEHLSTETRKIVKEEARNIYFLDDERGYFKQDVWSYQKSEVCTVCLLSSICVGLYDGGASYDLSELYPVFIDPDEIIEKI